MGEATVNTETPKAPSKDESVLRVTMRAVRDCLRCIVQECDRGTTSKAQSLDSIRAIANEAITAINECRPAEYLRARNCLETGVQRVRERDDIDAAIAIVLNRVQALDCAVTRDGATHDAFVSVQACLTTAGQSLRTIPRSKV